MNRHDGFRIRRAISADDRQAVASLMEQILPGESRDVNRNLWWVVTEATGTAVGFAGLKLMPDGPAFLMLSGILPKFRGNALQKRLIRVRLRHAVQAGFRQSVTYTVVGNVASANSLISCGFRAYEPEYAWAGRSVNYWIREN